MMRKPILWILILLGTLVPVQLLAQTPSGSDPKGVTLGVLAFRPKPIVEAQCAPLVDYLNHAQTGAHVRLHVLTYPEMEQAVAQRKVDIVLTQPANYVQMSYRYGLSAPFATLVNLEGNVPLHAYGGVIVTKAERTDLRGKKIATVSRRSFGGYLMAAYELSHAGVPLPQGDRLVETGVPHDRAIEAVLAGDADAAFVRSGLIESMMKEGKLREGQLRVLNRQDQADYPHALSTRLYPEWPVATLPHVDEEIANNIAAALLRLPHGGTVARKADVNGFVVPMDYSPVIEVLKSLRQPPFDKAPEFSLGDIWRKHFWQLVLVGIMLVLILLVLVLLMRYNRRLFDLKNRAEAGDQRLRQFSAQLPGVIFQYHLRQDGTAHFPYVSEGAQALYGVSPDAMNEDAKNLSARIHPEDVAQYQARICQSAETMQEWRGEYRIVLSDGSVHWRMSSATPQRLNDGTLLWHGYAADIDDRKAEEARSELLVAALEASANAIVITDLNGQIRWGNQAFCEMTGYQQDELIGAHANILRSGKHGKSFYRNMWKTLKAGNPWRGEVINRRKDGRLIDEELIITPVKDKKGNVHHYISVQQDISERKRMEAELRIQASTDTLTGLPNRRSFFQRAEAELALIRRGKAGGAALIMFDIDRFKRINDTYGHAIGDQVLCHLSTTLLGTLRRSDFLSRIGGEEFVVLLPETSIDEARQFAERLREKLERSPITVDDLTFSYTASFGVTVINAADTKVDMPLARADNAMYRSKEGGRNRVEIL